MSHPEPNPRHELRADRIAHALRPTYTFPLLSAPGTRITTSTSTAYLALAALPALLMGHADAALFLLLLPLAVGALAVSLVLPGLLLGARLERVHFSAFSFRVWADGEHFTDPQATRLILAGFATAYGLTTLLTLSAFTLDRVSLLALALAVLVHLLLFVTPRLGSWARTAGAFHVDRRAATAFRGVFG